MHSNIAENKGDSIPFLVGESDPYRTDYLLKSRKINDSVKQVTPNRLTFIGYSKDKEPFVITKTDNDDLLLMHLGTGC